MSAITFDTHKIIKRLEASGVPSAQAEATVEAFAEMVDAGQSDLATKGDLEAAIARLDYRISLLQWMMGGLLAGVGSLVLKTFFHA